MIIDTSDDSWEMFLLIAQKAKENNESWGSPKQNRTYRIQNVEPNMITIVRISGEVSELGKRGYQRFLEHFNEGNGTYSRKDYKGITSKMATIMHLHPLLKWVENYDVMIVENKEKLSRQSYKDYGAISDDTEIQLQTFARRVRKGQSKFRSSLMEIYGNSCCISGCQVLDVLEACHIEAHSKNGVNSVNNGLLLRSDLHILFDEGYLFIEPDSLIVHVHPQLKGSEYWSYHGQPLISNAIAAAILKYDFLVRHWGLKHW